MKYADPDADIKSLIQNLNNQVKDLKARIVALEHEQTRASETMFEYFRETLSDRDFREMLRRRNLPRFSGIGYQDGNIVDIGRGQFQQRVRRFKVRRSSRLRSIRKR